MDGCTLLSGAIGKWDALRECSIAARWLWVNLYTSSRKAMVGLWQGGVLTFADVAKMTLGETVVALDDLLEHELVEFDKRWEVLRLTKLPDFSGRPPNGSVIHSMWTLFKRVPICDVRNAHVRTLYWLLSESEKLITPDHADAWEKTFGTVQLPAVRRRGVRTFTDSDTSTTSQPGLFVETTNQTEIVTAPHQIGHRVPHGLDLDLDRRSLLLFSEESKGEANEAVDKIDSVPVVAVPRMDDLPFSVEDMLSTLARDSGGRFIAQPFDGRLTGALCATIRSAHQNQIGLDDLRVVGAWWANGGLAYRSDLGASWLTKPGNLIDAVAQARAWVAQGRPRIRSGGIAVSKRAEVAPVGAHGSGRRKL